MIKQFPSRSGTRPGDLQSHCQSALTWRSDNKDSEARERKTEKGDTKLLLVIDVNEIPRN